MESFEARKQENKKQRKKKRGKVKKKLERAKQIKLLERSNEGKLERILEIKKQRNSQGQENGNLIVRAVD